MHDKKQSFALGVILFNLLYLNDLCIERILLKGHLSSHFYSFFVYFYYQDVISMS